LFLVSETSAKRKRSKVNSSDGYSVLCLQEGVQQLVLGLHIIRGDNMYVSFTGIQVSTLLTVGSSHREVNHSGHLSPFAVVLLESLMRSWIQIWTYPD